MKYLKEWMIPSLFMTLLMSAVPAAFGDVGSRSDNSSDSTQAEERPLSEEESGDRGGSGAAQEETASESGVSDSCFPEGETRGFEGPGDIPPTHPGLQGSDVTSACLSERAENETGAADQRGGSPEADRFE